MDGLEKEKQRAKQLAEEHWQYHEIMMQAVSPTTSLGALGEWYKAIALHFYMHGVEDTKRNDFLPTKGGDAVMD